MVFLMPPFMVPDEGVHFDRAYQVAQGKIVSKVVDGKTGGFVPIVHAKGLSVRNVPLVFDQDYFNYISKKDDSFVAFPNTAVYSFVNYIPQAIGIKTAQLVYPSIGLMLIFGRIFNLAFFILLLFFTIKIAKQGKWVYVVAGLFPMTIQQAASLSCDAMTISLAFLTIASIHYLFLSNLKLSKKHYMLFLLLVFGLGLTKQTNIVLLLPLLFVPLRLFKSLKYKVGFIFSVIFVAFGAMLSWYFIVKLLHYDMSFSPFHADQYAQFKFIIGNPVTFIKTLLKTYIYSGAGSNGTMLQDFFFGSIVGVFSWLTYKLPLVSVIAEYILLFIALIYNGQKNEKQNYLVVFSLLQIITALLSIIAIAFILYLTWTEIGANQIYGLQGRYFIPLIPLLIAPFIFLRRYIKLTFEKPYQMGLLVGIISIINLMTMTILTIEWFYKR